MNVANFFSSVVFAALSGCTQARGDETSAPPAEAEGETSSAYTYEDGILTIHGDFNPYKGNLVGMYCDGCGTEDGWTRPVATIVPLEDGSLKVDLEMFGDGADIRWSLALMDANMLPTQWLWESGEVGSELEENDPLGITIPVQECVGTELVDKIDFCTQITPDGIFPGSCWGTYVPPTDCDDADGDGDIDPDADGDDDDGDDDSCDDTDADGDSYSECDGDCDDGYPNTYPGATEYGDGEDQDCDGEVDEGCDADDNDDDICDGVDNDDGDDECDDPDKDGDGYDAEECGGDDCDDGWPYNHPGADEYNDDVDQDCDGEVDEDCEEDDAEDCYCD